MAKIPQGPMAWANGSNTPCVAVPAHGLKAGLQAGLQAGTSWRVPQVAPAAVPVWMVPAYQRRHRWPARGRAS